MTGCERPDCDGTCCCSSPTLPDGVRSIGPKDWALKVRPGSHVLVEDEDNGTQRLYMWNGEAWEPDGPATVA